MEKEKKLRRFRNWFFKGRIEKARIKRERIEILSREYDEGNISNINLMVKNG